MSKILDNVNEPKDVKKLNLKEKKQLAQELRELTIETVSKTGGHLASNLGVVELTIALHSIFDTPKDKIVWDVGHQTYIHKILTGRKDKINTLRKLNGLAGFPKTCESEHDCFNTGHSSTSISVALGMAKARDIKKEKYEVIAVIGDGALTGGMALEALNDAGASNTNITVVLNDNEMSISKNVGGIATFLAKLRTRKVYTNINVFCKKAVMKIPFLGKVIVRIVRSIKYFVKKLIMPNMLFEDMGFKYLGPVDGHNIEVLEAMLKVAKEIEEPVLIHILTKKGKGYEPAELNPGRFHGTSSFNIETGENINPKKKDYSAVFGNKLVEMAKKDDKIVAVTAAMCDGTGLTTFKKEFPNRFFDVGIAEQHALGFVAGLAANGLKPVISIYSSFYQRGYDQIIHDICIQKLPVVMCVDRAGIVGNDGETHQGIFDMSFLSIIPNITIMAPKNFEELESMMEFAINMNSPVVIRYPRGGEENVKFNENLNMEYGKAEVLKEGKDLTIIAIGKMVARAYEVAQELEKEGKNVSVINARFLRPLDQKILENIKISKKVITLEDNIIKGGLGSAVLELLNDNGIENVETKILGYPLEFVKHGSVSEIEKLYYLDRESVKKEILKMI